LSAIFSYIARCIYLQLLIKEILDRIDRITRISLARSLSTRLKLARDAEFAGKIVDEKSLKKPVKRAA
jgi:hypothetical protein